MKIVRHFLITESAQHGNRGFLPLWIPQSAGFDPGSIRLCMHDMLEHSLSDKGEFHQEVTALGRMLALRGIPGVDTFRGGTDVSESIGREISSAWVEKIRDEDDTPTFADCPPTGRLENYVERYIKGAVEKAMTAMVSEFKYASLDEWPDVKLPGRSFAAKCLGWLRIGYRDAIRRYGDQDHGCWDNGNEAFRWATDKSNQARLDSIGEAEEYDGCVLRLCWDTKALRMTDRLFESNPETGSMPGWIRRRIWQHTYT